MMGAAPAQQRLVGIETPTVIADLVSYQHPRPMEAIFEEPLFGVSAQQNLPHISSVGRYHLSSHAESFFKIGKISALPARVPLEVRASGGPAQLVRCMIKCEQLEKYINGRDLYDHKVLLTCLDIRHELIGRTLAQLGKELREPGLANVAMTEALGIIVIINFARYLDERPYLHSPRRGGLSPRQYRRLTEFIDAQECCPSLSELGELLDLSVRHLTRAFKQTSGETICDHIERIRFERAQALLADTDLLIKNVAYRLGFACSGSFATAFRRLAGETPAAYRKRARKRN
jgi:AraC family transcriptional regulator